jgi:hypothetical protein
MTALVARAIRMRWLHNGPRSRGYVLPMAPHSLLRSFSIYTSLKKIEKTDQDHDDPRIHPSGRSFTDDFATIRDHYGTGAAAIDV